MISSDGRDLSAVPAELRSLRGWLMWKAEAKPGESKPRKVPYYVNGTRRHYAHGSGSDRRELATFAQAESRARRHSFGIGLALMPEFGVVALDFDHCVVDGEVHPDVLALVGGTYAEYSPSGTGVRAFYLGELADGKSLGEQWPFGFEVFSSKGFVTVTGQVLDGAPSEVAPLRETVREFAATRFGSRPTVAVDDDPFVGLEPPVEDKTADDWRAMLAALDPDMSRESWIDVGMGLHHQFDGDEEGFTLWDEWSAQGSKYPGEAELRKQWDSFGRRTDRRQVTARSILKMAKSAGYVERAHVDAVAVAEAVERADAAGEPLKFPILGADEYASQPALRWIVKGLVPKAGLGVMFGESGSGKTFVTLDLIAAIATGREWRGHRVEQTRVGYICAEGREGFRGRLRAWQTDRNERLGLDRLAVIPATPDFMQKSDVSELVRTLQSVGEVGVLVVDTYAAVTPAGDENSAMDTKVAVAHCMAIHEATGALVLLVHHAGKDTSKGARGSTALRAAADFEVEVRRDGEQRELRVTKQKDAEDGSTFPFVLKQVQVGVDEDGMPVHSCVVEHREHRAVACRPKPSGRHQELLYEILAEEAFLRDVDENWLVDKAVAATPPMPRKDGRGDRRRSELKAALDRLLEVGVVETTPRGLMLAEDVVDAAY